MKDKQELNYEIGYRDGWKAAKEEINTVGASFGMFMFGVGALVVFFILK